MTDWATPTDVKTYTGIEVTQDEVTRAQFLMELFAGVTTDASDQSLISSRNLRHLSMAVAFQAAWMTEHPDVYTNVDVTSFSQDGQSATQAHANAALLAPLAQRCIARLTWMRGSLRARKPLDVLLIESGNRDSTAYDEHRPDWVPTS